MCVCDPSVPVNPYLMTFINLIVCCIFCRKSILAFSSLFLFARLQAQADNSKYALLIGVSVYADPSWGPPLSSENDVKLLRSMLLSRGFPESNILLLVNEKATYDGISAAFKQLREMVTPGSAVYFHFSGHGQQIFDTTYPKLDEQDGYDEALVPYDAPKSFPRAKSGVEKHFRDDQLFEQLQLLRRKLGAQGSLFVTLDACHSGTATRGVDQSLTRGTSIPYKPAGYSPKRSALVDQNLFEDIGSKESVAPITCFYACAPFELNTETKENGQGVGALTYSVIRALEQTSTFNTYGSLFERIRRIMNDKVPGQTPQYEGAMNAQIFNGKLSPPRSYVIVDKVVDPKKRMRIQAGMLNGLNKGTELSFYAADSDTTGIVPMAKGFIDSVSLTQSFVTITATAPNYYWKKMDGAWGYVTQPSFPFTLAVSMGDVKNPALLRGIQKNSFVSVGKDAPYLTAFLNKRKDSVYFMNRYGYPSKLGVSLKDTAQMDQALRSILLRAARAQFYRSFHELTDTSLISNVIFQPFFSADSSENLLLSSVDRSGNPFLHKNDSFRVIIHFRKPLTRKLFYDVVDIQPDDIAYSWWQNAGSKMMPEQRVIPEKSMSYELPDYVKISDPFGKEHLLFLFSQSPIYLDRQMLSRGSSAVSLQEAFDLIRAESGGGQTRSGNTGKGLLSNKLYSEVIRFEIRPSSNRK